MRNTTSNLQANPMRAAFTLVELMVAITIAALLAVVGLPRVREALQQNAAARAATVVKGAFENARSQAIRTGRPYGVRLHRATNAVTQNDQTDDPTFDASHGANYCKKLSYVQVAHEYRGDEVDARVRFVGYTSTPPRRLRFRASREQSGLLFAIASGWVPRAQQPIAAGSVLRIGTDRTPFVIESLSTWQDPNDSADYTDLVVSSSSPLHPGGRAPTINTIHEFSIRSRPLASPLSPVELPGKIVIDLASSGTSQDPDFLSPYSIGGGTDSQITPPPLLGVDSNNANIHGFRDVIVLFNATGALDSIFVDVSVNGNYVYTPVQPLGAVSFLVGKIGGVAIPPAIAMIPFERTGSSGTTPAFDTDLRARYGHKDRRRPNFADSDATWVTINPVSGKPLLHTVAGPFSETDPSAEARVHPEYSDAHSRDIIQRNRLLDSRRFVRGQSI
jgi:prepilin-type N-terminal cleavage/methylation domain-containing protein